MPTEKLLTVVDPAKFLISHEDYQDDEPAEARRKIKKLLDKYQVGVTPELISADRLKDLDNVRGQVILSGVTYVRCFFDDTDDTGKIAYNQPVVIDTVEGWGVTGINPKWGADEYKVFGIALAAYEDADKEDGGRIPVRIQPPLEEGSFNICLVKIPTAGIPAKGKAECNVFELNADGNPTQVQQGSDPLKLDIYNLYPVKWYGSIRTIYAQAVREKSGKFVIEKPPYTLKGKNQGSVSAGGTGSVLVVVNNIPTTQSVSCLLNWMHGGQGISNNKEVLIQYFEDEGAWVYINSECETGTP